MTKKTLNERVAELESELAAVKLRLPAEPVGWRSIIGVFANDPAFDEAMRLGREYREGQSPKPRSTGKRANARTRH